jgi:transcriptional regulator with XRE-family HTH domain
MTENDKTVWWQPADAANLKQARSSTEMTRAEFARALSISEKQLTELEEGGSSAFYSERIKYQAGLKILGYFDLLTTKEEELKANASSAKKMEDARNKETIAQLDGVIETNKRDLAPETHQAPKVFQIRNGYVLGAVLVVAIIYAVLYIPNLQNNVKEDKAKTQVAVPAPVVMPSAPQASDAQTVASSSPEFGIHPVAPLTSAPTKTPLVCNWEGTPMPLKPLAAIRPSDRVHLVANADLQLCLKDSSGQVQEITLLAGDRKTFYGSGSPWLIYSPQMINLKVFYQGYHVFIPKEDTHFVKLEARL